MRLILFIALPIVSVLFVDWIHDVMLNGMTFHWLTAIEVACAGAYGYGAYRDK